MSDGQMDIFGGEEKPTPPISARRRKLTETDRWLAEGRKLRPDGWPVDGNVELDGVHPYCNVCRSFACPHAKPGIYERYTYTPPPRDWDEVEAVMEEAIERSDRPPSEEWKRHAHEMIRRTALRLPQLTSEDVWETGLTPPDNGSPDGDALGPAMRRAKTAGFIEPTGKTTTETNRPQRHKNPKRIWRSLIYRGYWNDV